MTVRTIRIPGAKAMVQQWLPKLIAMANGNGLELAPGIVLNVPETSEINLDVGADGRLNVSLPATTVSIDATQYCIHVRGTQPMGAISVSDKTATGEVEGVPFGQGKFLLVFDD